MSENQIVINEGGSLTNQETVEYTLPEDNKQIFAAKYLPYMPTKDELRRELNLEEFEKKEK